MLARFFFVQNLRSLIRDDDIVIVTQRLSKFLSKTARAIPLLKQTDGHTAPELITYIDSIRVRKIIMKVLMGEVDGVNAINNGLGKSSCVHG